MTSLDPTTLLALLTAITALAVATGHLLKYTSQFYALVHASADVAERYANDDT